ncbi:response regulator [Streptomyces sp. NBC_01262]|nr:response regulator [Streptomyces sp. NBC_01262]
MRVLVLEDDLELRPLVADQLRGTGFAVDLARTLAEADLKLSVNRYDCVVADRSVPHGDSLTLLAAHRCTGSVLPFLLLTALDAVSDRVAGFEHGADDYLVKPFAFAERPGGRSAEAPGAPGGVLLSLSAKEFAVLELPAHLRAYGHRPPLRQSHRRHPLRGLHRSAAGLGPRHQPLGNQLHDRRG